jgi:hypothetical protein
MNCIPIPYLLACPQMPIVQINRLKFAGKQFPIVHTASAVLYPCVQLNRNVTVEANFGQKPFKYNIDECPGLQLHW